MPIRILLADDHALVRDGLAALLAAWPDMEVVGSVGDGRAAVQMAAELRPDVVVLDIAMPEMNGIEASRPLLKASPASRILILSMHAGAEHIYQALLAGATGYLLKESASAEFVSAVRAVGAGKRYLSQKISRDTIAAYIRQRGAGDPLGSLSARERQVLQLIVEGHTSAAVASRINLSPKTVDTYRSRLMRKLEVDDLPALVKFAIRHGIIDVE